MRLDFVNRSRAVGCHLHMRQSDERLACVWLLYILQTPADWLFRIIWFMLHSRVYGVMCVVYRRLMAL